MAGEDLENERTIVDLNLDDLVAESQADEAKESATPPEVKTESRAAKGNRPSDDDLLADLDFLGEAPQAEKAPESASRPPPLPPPDQGQSASQTAAGRGAARARARPQTPPSPPALAEEPTPPVSRANPDGAREARKSASRDMARALGDVSVELVAVVGRREMKIEELAALEKGSLLDLSGYEHRLVELVVGGKAIGYGELILVDGQLGIKIASTFGESS